MFTLQRSGSAAAAIAAEMRNVPARQVPLITAKALTFSVQKAQSAIVAAIPGVFLGGATRYTLNSTRIEPATVAKLSARVAVKDRAAGDGTLPENYLFPQVFGGGRREKRFERLLRYEGLLQRGERVLPGARSQLDSYGNLGRAALNRVLDQLRGQERKAKTTSQRRKLARRKNDLFVGAPAGGARRPGVYRREGRRLRPLLIFSTAAPVYSRRLNFEGLAAQVVQREFEPTFLRLLRSATGAR